MPVLSSVKLRYSFPTRIRNPYGDFQRAKICYEAHQHFRTINEKLQAVCKDLILECHRRKYIVSSNIQIGRPATSKDASDQKKKIIESFEKQVAALQKDVSKLNLAGSELKGYIEDIQRNCSKEGKRKT